MVNTYYFTGHINLENIERAINVLNSYEKNIHLFFETDEGGYTDVMDYFIFYLNKRKSDITVYLTGSIVSAGTKILTDFKGNIVLLENLDFILFHKWDREIYTLRKGGSVDNLKLISITEEHNKNFRNKLKKLGLSEEELLLFDKGKDIVLFKDDFKKLNINNNN